MTIDLNMLTIDVTLITDSNMMYFKPYRYPSEAVEHLDHLDLQLNLGSNIFILSSTPPPLPYKHIFYSDVLFVTKSYVPLNKLFLCSQLNSV